MSIADAFEAEIFITDLLTYTDDPLRLEFVNPNTQEFRNKIFRMARKLRDKGVKIRKITLNDKEIRL